MLQQSLDDNLLPALLSYLPPAVARALYGEGRAPTEPRGSRVLAAVLLGNVGTCIKCVLQHLDVEHSQSWSYAAA